MSIVLERVKRPLLALSLLLLLGAGAASAYDGCSPCARQNVVVKTQPVYPTVSPCTASVSPCTSSPCSSVGYSTSAVSSPSVSYGSTSYEVVPAPATTPINTMIMYAGEEVPYVPGL